MRQTGCGGLQWSYRASRRGSSFCECSGRETCLISDDLRRRSAEWLAGLELGAGEPEQRHTGPWRIEVNERDSGRVGGNLLSSSCPRFFTLHEPHVLDSRRRQWRTAVAGAGATGRERTV